MQYPARFTDSYGTETTTITNDGHMLRMTLRGVAFESDNLADWYACASPYAPQPGFDGAHCSILTTLEDCSQGNVWRLELFTLELTLPVPVLNAGRADQGLLVIQLFGPKLIPDNAIDVDHSHMVVALQHAGEEYGGTQPHCEMEYALLLLRANMPPNVQLPICFFCGLSDYSPYGCDVFGAMLCFRANKAAYHAVRTKIDMLRLISTEGVRVQETYSCPEFEPRPPHHGYRG